jgi:stage II sporulation protein M
MMSILNLRRKVIMNRTARKQKKNRISNVILEFIQTNSKTCLILLIIFFIGVLLGVIFVNNCKETQENQIKSYIQNFVDGIRENYQISSTKLLWNAIMKNFITALVLWFLGLTLIGVPLIYLFIGYKGYCIGFTAASIIATLGGAKGTLFIASTMLLQNIIYIPIIIALATSSVKLYKKIMEDRRRENIKTQILKHTIFSVFMLVILILNSFIEAYISGGISSMLLKYC